MEQNKQQTEKSNNLMTPNRTEESSSKRGNVVMILVFVILGIAIFGLPYITEYLEKREEEKENRPTPTPTPTQVPTPTPVIKVMDKNICTETLIDLETHTSEKQYILESENDKIKKVTVITTLIYEIEDEEYQTMQTSCQDNSLKYISNPGYEVSCEVKNLQVETTEVFELEEFVPIIEEDKTINSPIALDASLQETISKFAINQTVCQ